VKGWYGVIYKLAIGLFSLLLAACDPIDIKSQDSLTASDAARSGQAPNCAQCHAYPPKDILHQFHLTSYVVNRDGIANVALNGPVTCLDCHFKSVKHFSFAVSESTWVDTNGNEMPEPLDPSDELIVKVYRKFHPLPYPGTLPGWSAAIDTVHRDSLAKVLDTLVMREARIGRIIQWMTSVAHMDGSRSVNFAPNNVTDSSRLDSAFRPSELSCSSVACHNKSEVRYRWASPARGISGCPSLLGQDSTCGETTP
jgi:hypothetical protein